MQARDVVAAATALEHVRQRAAREGGVAGEEEPVRLLVEADRPRRVPRCVEHAESEPAGVHEAPVVQLELGLPREMRACVARPSPCRSLAAASGWAASNAFGNAPRTPRMVGVLVGEQHERHLVGQHAQRSQPVVHGRPRLRQARVHEQRAARPGGRRRAPPASAAGSAPRPRSTISIRGSRPPARARCSSTHPLSRLRTVAAAAAMSAAGSSESGPWPGSSSRARSDARRSRLSRCSPLEPFCVTTGSVPRASTVSPVTIRARDRS